MLNLLPFCQFVNRLKQADYRRKRADPPAGRAGNIRPYKRRFRLPFGRQVGADIIRPLPVYPIIFKLFEYIRHKTTDFQPF
ncbi:MAG: hypothetical protein FWG68_06105 [Defluviitaleaceae bacterium]|nr:hypothetical protein [Defluviitaleaceae bacterium]